MLLNFEPVKRFENVTSRERPGNSDVNKATRYKIKDKAKTLGGKAKATDCKAKAKNFGLKAKAQHHQLWQ